MTTWQPNRDTEEQKWNKEQRRGGDRECSKEIGWMEEKKGNPWNNMKHLSKKKKLELFCCALYFQTELINWTQANQLSTQLWNCTTGIRRQSTVCLQASKLNDVNYPSILRGKPDFNRAWHWDIFGANKVERAFSDCPNQTAALSRQWAVDNP